MVCINDTGAVDNFQICKNKSIVFLDSVLPDKSSFELTDNKEVVAAAKAFVTAWEQKQLNKQTGYAGKSNTYLYF